MADAWRGVGMAWHVGECENRIESIGVWGSSPGIRERVSFLCLMFRCLPSGNRWTERAVGILSGFISRAVENNDVKI
jgi:hypothetical protein